MLSDLEPGNELSVNQSLRLLALGPFPFSKLLMLSLHRMTLGLCHSLHCPAVSSRASCAARNWGLLLPTLSSVPVIPSQPKCGPPEGPGRLGVGVSQSSGVLSEALISPSLLLGHILLPALSHHQAWPHLRACSLLRYSSSSPLRQSLNLAYACSSLPLQSQTIPSIPPKKHLSFDFYSSTFLPSDSLLRRTFPQASEPGPLLLTACRSVPWAWGSSHPSCSWFPPSSGHCKTFPTSQPWPV